MLTCDCDSAAVEFKTALAPAYAAWPALPSVADTEEKNTMCCIGAHLMPWNSNSPPATCACAQRCCL